jgi:hypothetical protein
MVLRTNGRNGFRWISRFISANCICAGDYSPEHFKLIVGEQDTMENWPGPISRGTRSNPALFGSLTRIETPAVEPPGSAHPARGRRCRRYCFRWRGSRHWHNAYSYAATALSGSCIRRSAKPSTGAASQAEGVG